MPCSRYCPLRHMSHCPDAQAGHGTGSGRRTIPTTRSPSARPEPAGAARTRPRFSCPSTSSSCPGGADPYAPGDDLDVGAAQADGEPVDQDAALLLLRLGHVGQRQAVGRARSDGQGSHRVLLGPVVCGSWGDDQGLRRPPCPAVAVRTVRLPVHDSRCRGCRRPSLLLHNANLALCQTASVAEVNSRTGSTAAGHEGVDGPEAPAVERLLELTRVLVALAERSVAVAAPTVSLPQFRALLVLDRVGPCNGGGLAEHLGTHGSTVTRICDRLVALEYVTRDQRPENRREVALEVTAQGRAVVRAVEAYRADELGRLVQSVASAAPTPVRRARSPARRGRGSARRVARRQGPLGRQPTCRCSLHRLQNARTGRWTAVARSGAARTRAEDPRVSSTPHLRSATREGGRLRAIGLVQLAAGLWLLAAHFVLHYPRYHPDQRAFVVDLVVGALVTWFAGMHLLAWDSARWASRLTLPLGLFLAAAPPFLGYTTDPDIRSAGVNDLVTGLVIVAGAALALAASTARD